MTDSALSRRLSEFTGVALFAAALACVDPGGHAIIVAHPPRKNSLPLVGQMSDRHQPRRQETSRLIPNMKQFLPEMRAWRSPIPWIIARAASHFAR